MLGDKLPDAANLALGALVFAQFLEDRPFSRQLAAAGIGIWLVYLPAHCCWAGEHSMTDQEINLFIIFGGMLLFATGVTIYDLLAERQHRRKREQQRRSA